MLTHTRHTLHTFTHHAYTNRVRTSFLVPLRTRLPLMTSCASGNSTLVPTSGMATVSNGATTGIGSADPSPAAFTARPRFASQSNAFPVLNIMPATQTHTTTNTTTNNNMANHATASAGHLRHFSSASAMISPTNATTRAGTSLTSPDGIASSSSAAATGARAMHSPSDASPFLIRNGPRGADFQAASKAAADHTHSDSCGCNSHTPLDGDDIQVETGSESFLKEVNEGISALKDATDRLTTEDSSHTQVPVGGDVPKWNLNALLDHNHRFVMRKNYEPFLSDRFPYKRIAVITCMDTRLTELLPMALDLKNGDAKIIKVAGAMVAHPFGSVMRSVLVAVYALKAEHILVIGHHDCGMTGMDSSKILNQARQRGIPDSTFKTLKAAGLDLDSWLSGFDNVVNSVLHSVNTIKNHPLLNFEETSVNANEVIQPEGETKVTQAPTVAKTRIPKITVTGFVICPTTGKLDLVTPADESTLALIRRHREEEDAAADAEPNNNIKNTHNQPH